MIRVRRHRFRLAAIGSRRRDNRCRWYDCVLVTAAPTAPARSGMPLPGCGWRPRDDAWIEPRSSRPKSVAVLAFSDLSPEQDGEYFSDGISEELLNVLAKVPGLKVAARTSAFYFK